MFCGRFANIQKERGTASGKRLKKGEMAQTVVKQKSADESSSFFCWLFFLPKTPFLHWGKQRPRESGKAGAEYKKHQRQHHRYRHHRTNTVVNLPVLAKAKYTTSFKYHQLLIAYPLSPDTHNNRWKKLKPGHLLFKQKKKLNYLFEKMFFSLYRNRVQRWHWWMDAFAPKCCVIQEKKGEKRTCCKRNSFGR